MSLYEIMICGGEECGCPRHMHDPTLIQRMEHEADYLACTEHQCHCPKFIERYGNEAQIHN